MVFRRYRPSDCAEVAALFYDTVHAVNAADYTSEQLDAWAPRDADLAEWDRRLGANLSLVAVEGDRLVGFGDIDKTGYLDCLYVHAGFQRRGVATGLCDRLEAAVTDGIETHASITARPFFEGRGYRVITEQTVERRGVLLKNYVMKKRR